MDIRLDFTELKTSPLVWRKIQEIANEPSRNKKLDLLENTDFSFFKWVLKQVFDNTIVFGVKVKKAEWLPMLETAKRNDRGRPFEPSEVEFFVLLANGCYTRKEVIEHLDDLSKVLDADSFQLVVSIVNKDISAGINAASVNKIYKGLIPTYPYMRCSLPTQVAFDDLTWEVGVYAQEKADGMFNNINITQAGEVEILSRQGTVIPTDKLGESFQLLKDTLDAGYQYHGEMLLIKKDTGDTLPREIGNGVINSICKGGELPEEYWVYWQLWDMVPLYSIAPKGKYTEPYSRRYERLCQAVNGGNKAVMVIHTEVVHSLEAAQAFYRKELLMNHEGAVLKNATAIWRDGTSKEQVKMKMILDCDLIVTGYMEGDGRLEGTLGALVCESSDGKLKTCVSGFTDKMRNDIWAHQDDFLGSIVTVRFNDVMVKEGQPAALFLPRFVEFRMDKTEADDLNRIIDTQRQAIGG